MIRNIFRGFGLVVLLLVVLVVALVIWLRTSLPQLDGELALPGLSAPVEIIRDKNAIPHIYAETDHDLFMAVGFVHAQDRLWQMHLQRSIAAGRLTELVGARRDEDGESDNIDTDKFLRTMGIYRQSEEALEHLSPKTLSNLQSYAEGVNAFLDQRQGALPPEFLAVGASEIRPWTPTDSVAWLKMMMWDLGGNRSTELMNLVLSTAYSSDDLASLNGTYPGEELFVLPDLNQLYGREGADTAMLEGARINFSSVEHAQPESIGSNNWVAAGGRTESGLPLLANDPHLGIAAPALWYYVGMHSAESDYDTIGASLPGIPYIVLGRTDRTGWGFTNVGPDVQDFFLERVNPDNDGEYETPDGGMVGFEVVNEVIKVPGEDDILLSVRHSRHGPILSDLWAEDDGRAMALPDGLVAAFSWTALVDEDTTMDAMRLISRAQSVEEIDLFAPFMIGPQQNVVFADVDGGTGYIAPALVPIRGPNNKTDGMAPALGWDSDYDWQGFIPYDGVPRIDNPELRVTANEKIVEDDYPYFIRREWSAPYRGDRIKELLGEDTAFTPKRFAEVQQDTRANQAAELAPTMINRIKADVDAMDQVYRQALIEMIEWEDANYDATTKSAAMAIWAPWLRNLMISVMDDEIHELRPLAMTYRRFFERELVLGGPEGTAPERWCGSLPDQPGTVADCNTLMVQAFVDAVDGLIATQGEDPNKWQWGKMHSAVSDNSVFGGLPIVGGRADIVHPIGGSNHSVNVQAYGLHRDEPNEAFNSDHAPSLRHVFDFSDMDSSQFIYNAGQSGNILSGYYDTFAKDWVDGDMRPLSMNRDDILPGNIGVLDLVPGK